MAIYPIAYEGVHFMILPAPKFWNSPSKDNYQINFSGVCLIEPISSNNNEWNRQTIHIGQDIPYFDNLGFGQLQGRVQLPPLPNNANSYGFTPLQWTVFAAPSVVYNLGQYFTLQDGFAVDRFGLIVEQFDAGGNQRVNLMNGMGVDVAVRGSGNYLHRISYNIVMYGYFQPYHANIIN